MGQAIALDVLSHLSFNNFNINKSKYVKTFELLGINII